MKVEPTSIRHLPVEILKYIFELNGRCSWSPHQMTPVVCHVCSQWRSIAISTPTLWNNIQFKYDPLDPTGIRQYFWLQTMLPRAVGAKLDVAINCLSGWPRYQLIGTVLALLVPHAHAIQSLEISMDFLADLGWEAPLVNLLTRLTNVEELYMTHTRFRECFSTAELRCPLPFDAAVSALNSSGRLQRLDLRGPWSTPWNSAVYRSLLYLKIHGYAVPITLPTFFDVLRACPDLETFEYSNSNPLPLVSTGESFPIISLPMMEKIHLNDRSPFLAAVVDRIKVPGTCEISVMPYHQAHNGTSSAEVYSHLTLSAMIYQSHLPTCTSLTITARSNQEFSVFAVCGSCDLHIELERTDFDLPPMLPMVRDAFLQPFALASATLTCFEVIHHSLEYLVPEVWASCFAVFLNLETLRLEPAGRGASLGSMGIWNVAVALAEGGWVPHLRHLHFQDTVVDTEVVEVLMWMLSRRTAEGADPLKELTLISVGADRGDAVPSAEREDVVRALKERAEVYGTTVIT